MFKQAKGLVGLDRYEVGSWQDCYRRLTLALPRALRNRSPLLRISDAPDSELVPHRHD